MHSYQMFIDAGFVGASKQIALDNLSTAAVIPAAVNGEETVGLSACLSSTVVNTCEVMSALIEANMQNQVRVGGAPVTTEYLNEIGVDYARDVRSAIEPLWQLLEV